MSRPRLVVICPACGRERPLELRGEEYVERRCAFCGALQHIDPQGRKSGRVVAELVTSGRES